MYMHASSQQRIYICTYLQAHAYITHTWTLHCASEFGISGISLLKDTTALTQNTFAFLFCEREVETAGWGSRNVCIALVCTYLYILVLVLVHTHHYQANEVRNASCLSSYCTYI